MFPCSDVKYDLMQCASSKTVFPFKIQFLTAPKLVGVFTLSLGKEQLNKKMQ